MGHHTEVPGRKISLFNLAVVLALTLGSLTYGYTFSITSTTLGQPGWYLFFDLSSEATGPKYSYTQAITGTMNGLFCAGDFLGSIFIGWSCHAMGRKNSLWIASPLAIRGGALQAGAVHIGMFLIGRFIGGFAVGVVLVLGYSLAAWTGFACFFPTNLSFQWRFPLAEQCLWPLLMLILTPWIPESPRWLIMNDRMDDAWSVIIKLHGVSQNDTTSAAASFAREEFYQMKQQAVVDKATASGESFGTLFTKPSYRKRMLCAFFTMFASESTGILVVYNYSVLLYQGLGFDNKISLLLSALYVSVACAGNYISSILVDRVGRVKLFLIGFSGCLISLIFETVMVARYTGSTNKAGLRAGVFFLFIYIFFYGCCVDATTYVYCSEIFPSHIRARGVAFSLSILFLTALVYLEAAPTAFAHIGWKYYVVFLVVTLVNIFVVWWLFPETKGLSLEEIGELFGDDVAVQLTQLTMEERELLDQKILSEKSMGDEIHIEVNTERSEGN
ncbi:hypothetical protein N7481_003227 [Penicillium waksmanii]|uniref:uncharacterized protein n=1 Tax=Penicillium waksmanii TaxID=69791 RepID=UPI002548B8C6|nr:uncharacterized protein N7481_003227 [Penicillium waksmanii]KAJ5988017.1 hypothetical protein N7481_003227 [Penicillium waksmanii]